MKLTAVCLAFAIWLLLVAAVLLVPAFARIVGAAVLILLVLAAATYAEERRAETPLQYRGSWCATKWATIYRRCDERDRDLQLTIDRQTVMSEDTVCRPLAFRKGNGEHRVWLTCRDDAGEGNYSSVQERWRLGTNRTRLQILHRVGEP